MAQRLIEVLIPDECEQEAQRMLSGEDKVIVFWSGKASGGMVEYKILVDAEENQTIIDDLGSKFGMEPGFRMLLFEVEASLPVEIPKAKEKKPDDDKETKGVSREELYAAADDQSKLSGVFFLLMGLSAIVAAIGVLRSDVAVIIGAMVIAPLLGPNVGLSLATTLADPELAKKAVKTNLSGITLVFVIAVFIGLLIAGDPTESSELMNRTNVAYEDIALALAAGSAGALAYTRSIPSALIGVMVAIALVPALVASGLLLGSGEYTLSFFAFMLFMINLISVNLSGVLTFLLQGFKPTSWWQADKAKRLTRKAIVAWLVLLLLLIVVIYYLRAV